MIRNSNNWGLPSSVWTQTFKRLTTAVIVAIGSTKLRKLTYYAMNPYVSNWLKSSIPSTNSCSSSLKIWKLWNRLPSSTTSISKPIYPCRQLPSLMKFVRALSIRRIRPNTWSTLPLKFLPSSRLTALKCAIPSYISLNFKNLAIKYLKTFKSILTKKVTSSVRRKISWKNTRDSRQGCSTPLTTSTWAISDYSLFPSLRITFPSSLKKLARNRGHVLNFLKLW